MSPGIMTEKQFQELQVQQREEKLKDLYPLDYLISVAAWNLAPKAVREELDPDDADRHQHHAQVDDITPVPAPVAARQPPQGHRQTFT